jgi:hypothetical protein
LTPYQLNALCRLRRTPIQSDFILEQVGLSAGALHAQDPAKLLHAYDVAWALFHFSLPLANMASESDQSLDGTVLFDIADHLLANQKPSEAQLARLNRLAMDAQSLVVKYDLLQSGGKCESESREATPWH